MRNTLLLAASTLSLGVILGGASGLVAGYRISEATNDKALVYYGYDRRDRQDLTRMIRRIQKRAAIGGGQSGI